MTAQNRATNKAAFEQGDQPQGSNYVDLIDSFVSIADTTVQSLSSDLTAPVLTATTEVSSPLVRAVRVSASAGHFTTISVVGVVSADRVHASAATIIGVVSADRVHASAATIIGAVSADRVHASAATILGVVSADRVHASAATFLAVVSADTIHASGASFTLMSAATLSFDAILTAMITASAADPASGQALPTTAAGFITAQVCGRTVAIPFFEV